MKGIKGINNSVGVLGKIKDRYSGNRMKNGAIIRNPFDLAIWMILQITNHESRITDLPLRSEI
jgi:hypothetical protein